MATAKQIMVTPNTPVQLTTSPQTIHTYNAQYEDDIYITLTNTAVAARTITFNSTGVSFTMAASSVLNIGPLKVNANLTCSCSNIASVSVMVSYNRWVKDV
jgi:hypothetical protein